MNKYISSVVFLTSSFLLSGCMTQHILHNSMTPFESVEEKTISEDIIHQIAFPSEHEDAQGFVLLGDKYSYHVTSNENISRIQDLFTNLSSKYIHMDDVTSFSVNEEEQTFKTTIKFKYHKKFLINKVEPFTEEEKQALGICFKHTHNAINMHYDEYTCEIGLTGKLYAPQQDLVQAYDLSKGRKIKLVHRNIKQNNNYGELLALPFTLAVDIVTLPVLFLWSLTEK